LRLFLVTGIFCASALTGCEITSVVQSNTSIISPNDLAVKHIYKAPGKNESQQLATRFTDPQLQQLISVALIDAPDMLSAKARLMRARQIAKGAYSTLWPSAGLNGYVDKQHFSFHGVVPPPLNELIFNNLQSADIALNFNYEVDFWGKNRANVATRLSEAFAAQMDLAETRLILSSAVARTYFELQNNLIQLRLAKENVKLQQEMSDIVLDRAKQGIESDIPVKTALADTQTALLSVENYKRAEMLSRNQLAVLLGKNPFNTQIEPKKFSYSSKQLTLPALIPANLLAQRPDIVAARALTQAAAYQIKVAKTAFYPNINLRGILSSQSLYFSQFFNVSFQTDSIRAAVDLPIFDAGARRANLGVKRTEFDLAVNQYNQTILNALKQVTDQIAALRTLNQQVLSQSKAFHTTETNYTLFHSRYKQGIIDYAQLIEIKQLLLQQQAMLYTLQTQQKQAFVALLAALGGEVSK
jgi:NodT family efflux transporter outer membrane factor (OMF) lipoprotein